MVSDINLLNETDETTPESTGTTQTNTNYYDEYFTPTENGLNGEFNNINVGCITSNNEKFSLDSDGNLIVNSLTTANSNNQSINIDQVYPIGSIYMNVGDVEPNTLFTGTSWQKLESAFLIGASTDYPLGVPGGSTTHNHTSAAHTHTSAAHTHTSAAHTHGAGNLAAAINFDAQTGIYTQWTTSRGAFTATGLKRSTEVVNNSSSSRSEATVVYGSTASTTPGVTGSTTPGNTGSTTPGNTGSSSNLPPYLPVNMWKRIS